MKSNENVFCLRKLIDQYRMFLLVVVVLMNEMMSIVVNKDGDETCVVMKYVCPLWIRTEYIGEVSL